MDTKEKYGYVYKITNCINGKLYIGIHKHRGPDLDTRYWAGGILINEAFRKYGKSNFSREIIEWCYSKEELNSREEYWIKEFDTRNLEIGYNLAAGGFHNGGNQLGHKTTQETRQKISIANKGHIASDEARYNLSISHTGLKQSVETIEKRLTKTRGKVRSIEQRIRMSQGCKCRVYTNICEGCGKEFKATINSRKYCVDCRVKFVREREQLHKNSRVVHLLCKECGKIFEAHSPTKKLCIDCEINRINNDRIDF